MVYESGFTTRRTYSSRPVVTSYAVSTPRLDLCTERPGQHRSRGSSDYSYSYKSNVERSAYDSNNPYARPERSTYSSTVESSSRSGPGGSYNYNTERSSTTGAGPGGYSYSSTTSGTLPGGTKYRHFSYHYPSVSRVYKSSYPIYSSYTIPRRVYSGTRIVTSPVRVVTSPARIVTRIVRSPSPVRITRTTTRVISSPERTTTYSYSLPSYYSSSYLPSSYLSSSYLPSTYLSSSYLPSSYYSSYIPSSYVYSTPSYYYSPISRVYDRSLSPLRTIASSYYTPSYLKRIPPGYGARALTNYLNTEPFTTFREETNRIRYRAQSLMRDVHTPVIRRARSCTPFPVTGYTYGPTSQLALDAYVERITNPIRHIAKEVHNISNYPEPRKYMGKSHLASVRICGDKAYNIRNPVYDMDKVRTDINLLSWYLKHPQGKSEKKIEENSAIKEVEAVEVEA